jgi:hypothetical protein
MYLEATNFVADQLAATGKPIDDRDLITGSDFIMKENQTSQTLLHRLVDNGLYPIIDVSSLPHKPYGLTAMIEEKLLLSSGTII